jgi:RHS repeat-associated protein
MQRAWHEATVASGVRNGVVQVAIICLVAVLALLFVSAAPVLAQPGDPCPELQPEEFSEGLEDCEYDFDPWVWISPGSSTYQPWELTQDSLLVVITWCDDKGLNAGSRSILLNGASVTSQFDYVTESALGNCPVRRTSTGKVKLALGSNTLSASILDTASQSGGNGATYTLGTIGVVVGPKGRSITVRASLGSSETFAVRNTSSGSVKFNLARQCITPATSCTGPDTTTTLAPGATFVATVNFTAAASGTGGSIRLIASYSGGGTTVADTALISVSVGSTGAPAISVSDQNPGTLLARQNCVTVALGGAAAAECGDLRIVHPLPATRTLGLDRTPTLIYNSAHVSPTVSIAALVDITSARPDTVLARLTLGGTTYTRKWSGRDWGNNAAQRITVVAPDLSLTTGLHGYSLEVRNLYASDSSAAATTTGHVIVVNRSTSSFGAGWWLAGLEQLQLMAGDSILWIGGDGSARVYSKVATDLWLAPSLTRPDTLSKISGFYVRHMPRVRTVFNSTGQHVATVNRLTHQTDFAYSSGRLTTITIPVVDSIAPSDSSRRYYFTYTSGRLTKVTAPRTEAQQRAVNISRSTDRITAIKDADGDSVRFEYVGSTSRVRRRVDRRGTAHAYGYDIANKIAVDTLYLQGSGSDIVKAFLAAESRGAANDGTVRNSVHSDSAFARINGPRTDVEDLTTFWVNGLGSVTRVRNALGDTTSISYGSATFPALATRIRHPSGVIDTVEYNSRGLVTSSTTLNALGTSSSSSTTYTWHSFWDMPTKVVGPYGDSTRVEFGYSDSTGNRLWQADARGDTAKVQFRYYSHGLLRAVEYPRPAADASQYTVIRDSLAYDIRGNLRMSLDAEGDTIWTYADRLGRDTLVLTPLIGSLRARKRAAYNVMSWPTQTIDSVPALTYTLRSLTADTASVHALWHRVEYTYDKAGNQTQVQSFVPDLSDVRTDVSYTYDRANRLVTRSEGSGPRSLSYDPAGNVVSSVDANGRTVTQQYDELNRVRRRISPSVSYAQTSCGSHTTGPLASGTCQMRFPYYPNDGTGFLVSGDTAVFAYDSTGGMVRADNRYARIARSYYPGGQIKADTQRIGSYETPSTDAITIGLQYTYDAASRRSSLITDWGTTSYDYYRFGALRRIVDPGSTTYEWTYDALTRPDTFRVAASGAPYRIREVRRYYADGSSRWRVRSTDSLDVVLSDSLEYDKRGKVAEAFRESLVQYQSEQSSFHYDGLGAILAHERTSIVHSGFDVEEYRNDGFGNVYWSRSRNGAGGPEHYYHSQFSIVGELMERGSALLEPLETAQGAFRETTHQTHIGAGLTALNTTRESYTSPGGEGYVWLWSGQTASRHYYDGNSRLAAVQQYQWSSSANSGTWEDYRYDALGRRILTRTLRESGNAPSGSTGLCTDTGGICRSYLERVAWDGDQIAWEGRSAIGTSVGSNSGSIYYVHGPGLDAPLAVNRDGTTRVINYNWRGLAESSLLTNGNAGDCSIGNCTISVDWPSMAGAYLTRHYESASPPGAATWLGSLPANGAGSTGMLYRRNRYYDPGTGRFTQEDPIGLAGGLNLYGFAEGDPVNFDDPFGLFGCKRSECGCLLGSDGELAGTFSPALRDAVTEAEHEEFPPRVVSVDPSEALATGGESVAIGVGESKCEGAYSKCAARCRALRGRVAAACWSACMAAYAACRGNDWYKKKRRERRRPGN